jgi:hypothetical protein
MRAELVEGKDEGIKQHHRGRQNHQAPRVKEKAKQGIQKKPKVKKNRFHALVMLHPHPPGTKVPPSRADALAHRRL